MVIGLSTLFRRCLVFPFVPHRTKATYFAHNGLSAVKKKKIKSVDYSTSILRLQKNYDEKTSDINHSGDDR